MTVPMRVRRAAVTVGTALLAGACSDRPPVRIGVVAIDEGVAGARLAVAEINNAHGIHGRALSLRVMPGAGSILARIALVAADSLSADPTIIGVVGHSNSSASLSGSQIYNARHVVQIAPTSSAPVLSAAGPYTFRLVASDIHQARFLAKEITAGGARPPTAVFFVNDEYGRPFFQELRARLTEARVPLVLESPYSQDSPLTEVDVVARAVADSRAETVVWLGRSAQLRQLLPALRRLAPRIQVLASDGVDDQATERNADGVLTGVRFACFLDMRGSRPALVALRDRIRATTGTTATVETALAYDAVMLLATAAREVGTRRESIREYLASLGTTRPPFPGASGDIAFDENGDPRPSYCLAEVGAQGVRVIRSSAGP